MEDDKKVVPFPAHKVRRGSQNPETTEEKAKRSKDRKKAAFALSLLSVFVFATLWMSKISRDGSGQSGRNIANFEGISRDLEEEVMLARKIARDSVREPASQGRAPNAEEELRLGELAGRYSVKFESGALQEIVFEPSTGSEPIYVQDRTVFLNKHRDLFNVSFERVEMIERVEGPEIAEEVYHLLPTAAVKNSEPVTEGSVEDRGLATALRPVREIRFKLDKAGRLHSMKVQAPESN